MVVEKLYDQNNPTKTCYSGCQKTLFDQISKQSEHIKQNDRQNSNANIRDPVRFAIVDSLDCTLVFTASVFVLHFMSQSSFWYFVVQIFLSFHIFFFL